MADTPSLLPIFPEAPGSIGLLGDGPAEYRRSRMSGHRVQLRLSDEAMKRAELIAAANGIKRISKLCERLLDLEGDRLGIPRGVAGAGAATEKDGDEEHRIQIRAPKGLWSSIGPMVRAKGFKTISEMCREWLTRELRKFVSEGGSVRAKVTKKRKKSAARRK